MVNLPPPTLVHTRLNNHEQKDNYKEPSPPPKTYKYRLRLEVYEENDMNPSCRYAIDGVSIDKNESIINKLLDENFGKLMLLFNKDYFEKDKKLGEK